MDRVQRTYAHTAWTPADPLAGLDPELRRAILLMPSTFRERWRLAPWTDRAQRRLAIGEIIAERRLLYELTTQTLTQKTAEPTKAAASPAVEGGVASPYYRYRMNQHREIMAGVAETRQAQDRDDLANLPEARADQARRADIRRAFRDIAIERARLDIKEMRLLNGETADDAPEPSSAPLQRRKTKRRERGR